MRPFIVAQTGVGNSDAQVLDIIRNPFQVGFGVVVSGTVTYTVEHTFDNVMQAGVTPTWFAHPDVAAETTNQDGTYAFPVRAIRLSVTSGSGTATLTAIQAGHRGS